MASPYNNPVRAGYSFGIVDLLNGGARAAADDNYNQFDTFPPGHNGELSDQDFYDSAGGLMLPVDRMRRFVTPVDIDGTGRVLQYNNGNYSGTALANSDVGADQWGRVVYYSYFRPPGLPGWLAPPTSTAPAPGTVTYPWVNGTNNFPADVVSNVSTNYPINNNPLHGYEARSFRTSPTIPRVSCRSKSAGCPST